MCDKIWILCKIVTRENSAKSKDNEYNAIKQYYFQKCLYNLFTKLLFSNFKVCRTVSIFSWTSLLPRMLLKPICENHSDVCHELPSGTQRLNFLA